MEIIVLSPQKNQEKERDTIVQLFEHGLNTLHVNKPEMSTNKMIAYISAIPQHFHNRIIIHSHHPLAFKFNLKGIHFTKEHLKRTFKNWWLFKKEKWYEKKLIHTRSYYKISDVFNQEKYPFDYYILQNAFNPITNDFNIGFHPLRIQELKNTQKNIVVRGGVNLITAQKAKAFDFYGICLYSYIWKSENPIQAFIDIKQALQN